MVDGVHRYVSPVAKHVVTEDKSALEDVIILHLPVEEMIALAQMFIETVATILVRHYYDIMISHI